MTLQELAAETLMQKHKRLQQARCQHEDVYFSVVTGDDGTFTNGFCWDCGKQFRHQDPPTAQTSR